jgi:hypothetical protein
MAFTVRTSVYEVLKTLTSETNGIPPRPTAETATGNVTVSARDGKDGATRSVAQSATTLAKENRWGALFLVMPPNTGGEKKRFPRSFFLNLTLIFLESDS